MRIAVLISTYNAEKYICEQLDSIFKQEGNLEIHIYIRDDGSTDHTRTILKDYEEQKKVTVIQGQNVGPAHSFLQLFSMVSGYDFYAFADQDDYWYPHKLITEIKLFRNNNRPQIVFSNSEIVDSNLGTLGSNLFKSKPMLNLETVFVFASVQGCTMVWNNSLHDIVRNCDIPEIVIMHDSFLARVCVAVGGQIDYIDEPLIKYRQHENNVIGVSKSLFEKVIGILLSVIRKDPVSISEQAKAISDTYYSYIPEKNSEYINSIIGYRKNIKRRLSLLLNKNIVFNALSVKVIMSFKILMGTR